ncbi:MAG: hypothetical protein KF698_00190 [Anaerolineales bacterium]|nr:hypothetical protein [Anaerolineales bacterium]
MRTGDRSISSGHRPSERGQAIVLLVLVFVGLLGITGLAIDGGRLYTERRSVQNAADNAALAAAFALCNSGNAVSAGVASAGQNGFAASPPNVTVSVQAPPTSGTYSGNSEYVMVTITSRLTLGLGRIVYSGTPEVNARAVARCVPGAGEVGWGNGLIALDPDDNKAIDMTEGSSCIHVTGGGVLVNSSHSSQALFVSGGGTCGNRPGPRIQADWINVVGGSSKPAWVNVTPWPNNNGVPAVSDPLATLLSPPSMPALAVHPWTCSGLTSAQTQYAGAATNVYNAGHLTLGNHWYTSGNPMRVCPGRYNSFTLSSDANVIMEPGIYYIEGGNFRISDNARVVGNGVMIFVSGGTTTIGNGVRVTLSAPASGPYSGLVFYIDRGNTSTVTIDGGAITQLTGTLYAPASTLQLNGSGNSTTLNSQVIAARINMAGNNTALIINYDESVTFTGGGGASSIELTE